MNFSTILSMIVILGIIVGGFIYFLAIAVKKDKEETTD